jgi:hypothetical protein
MSAVRACHDPPNKGAIMSKSEDVINRAYGHIVKEVTPVLSFDVTIFRGFKYYWYKLIRKIKR